MTETSVSDRRFSWQTFAQALLFQVVLLSLLELYWYKSSGGWQSSNLAVLAAFAWIDAFMAYRWREIRQMLKNGTFREDEYRASPTAFYIGSPKRRLVVILGAVVLLIIWSAVETIVTHFF